MCSVDMTKSFGYT